LSRFGMTQACDRHTRHPLTAHSTLDTAPCGNKDTERTTHDNQITETSSQNSHITLGLNKKS